MTKYSALLICSVFSISSLLAQDLTEHRWKNRILLLLTEELDNVDLSKQIAEIKSSTQELNERKVRVFLISPSTFLTGDQLDQVVSSPNFFQKYKKTDAPFEMLLIGLDGGVKRRYEGYEKLSNIFGLIDGMPMRRAELRRNME